MTAELEAVAHFLQEAGDHFARNKTPMPSALREALGVLPTLQRREKSLNKILVLANEWGWDGVTNSKILENFLEEFVNGLQAQLAITQKMGALTTAARRADARGEEALREVLDAKEEARKQWVRTAYSLFQVLLPFIDAYKKYRESVTKIGSVQADTPHVDIAHFERAWRETFDLLKNDEPPLYFIQNKGHVGNCLLWWRKGSHGYTTDLNEAEQFTEEEARKIVTGRRPQEDFMYPVSAVLLAAQRHVVEGAL
jgi:hypothetical protein